MGVRCILLAAPGTVNVAEETVGVAVPKILPLTPVKKPPPFIVTVAVQLILFPLILDAVLLKSPLDHDGEKEEAQFKLIWEKVVWVRHIKVMPMISRCLFMIRILYDG